MQTIRVQLVHVHVPNRKYANFPLKLGAMVNPSPAPTPAPSCTTNLNKAIILVITGSCI